MSNRRSRRATFVAGLVLSTSSGAQAVDEEKGAPGTASALNAPASEASRSDWELELSISAHLAIPGAALQIGTDSIGLGIDVFGGARYQKLPLLFGLAVGGDFFAPKSRTFVQRDANVAHFWLHQQGLWIMPTIRLTPSEGAFRPFLEARGGMWAILTSNKARDFDGEVSEETRSAASAFGLSAGLSWDFREQAFCVASLSYMRGESQRLVSIDRAEVIDHTFFVDLVDTPPLEQWVIGLGIGGRL
ncbi:MAG: hypothetical protein B6A08_15430 [Sorangiineae bacterium NIC37A_2]|jgi:hypothetical protein|nr:MAG: hypothetical protein B6A08_15430 [Sorangiineae bacterium NIC37A_2]